MGMEEAAIFHEYLAHATEAIIGTILKHPDPSAGQLKELFTVACTALTKVREDPDFITDVTLVVRLRDENLAGFQRAIDDIKHFTEGFLEVEKKILVNHGISEMVARDLVEAAKRLRKTIREWTTYADNILEDVSELRDAACKTAGMLGQLEESQERRERFKNTLWRVGYGTAGAFIIGLNAANDVVTLSAVGIALSGGVGAALIAPAVPPP